MDVFDVPTAAITDAENKQEGMKHCGINTVFIRSVARKSMLLDANLHICQTTVSLDQSAFYKELLANKAAVHVLCC